MRASGSTTVLGRLPWAKTPAMAQLHYQPRFDVRPAVQSPDTDKPRFEKLTGPTGGVLANLSFGPFRVLPTQFLLLEGDKPVPLGSRALGACPSSRSGRL